LNTTLAGDISSSVSILALLVPRERPRKDIRDVATICTEGTIVHNGHKRNYIPDNHSVQGGAGKKIRIEFLKKTPVHKPRNRSRQTPHSIRFESNINGGSVGTDTTAMFPCNSNLDQFATKAKGTTAERFKEDQPLCISRLNAYGKQSGLTLLKVAEMNQSGQSECKVQKTPSGSSDQSMESDRHLEHLPDIPRGTHVGSVPCPHPDCGTSPTILYRSGRLSNEARSEIIEHLREAHNFSKFPCTVLGCRRQGKDGYFRHHDLVKHLEREHRLYSSHKKILPNKDLDLYGKSEDKLASCREVKVPCPHPDCATRLTILYRSGRFIKKARSEIIKHLREAHDFSEFPCTVLGCRRQGKDGYFRHYDLAKNK
jgi:hypothetical protein